MIEEAGKMKRWYDKLNDRAWIVVLGTTCKTNMDHEDLRPLSGQKIEELAIEDLQAYWNSRESQQLFGECR